MKKLALIIAVIAGSFASCSKCYDCTTTVEITDANGNVIDTEEQSEEVCTANKDEVDDKEADGYSCS
tara:strand:- start:5597 stop:5797 length:201 start_codon:yes stop_codon:yes gene_type:complete